MADASTDSDNTVEKWRSNANAVAVDNDANTAQFAPTMMKSKPPSQPMFIVWRLYWGRNA